MPLDILDATDGPSTGQLPRAEAADIQVEEYLESWLEGSPFVLLEEEPILWIARQASAATAETVLVPDLVGLDSAGNLVLVEVKRGRTPRDVITQALECAAWASSLTYHCRLRKPPIAQTLPGSIYDYCFLVYHGTYLLYDSQRDGKWDQAGKRIDTAERQT